MSIEFAELIETELYSRMDEEISKQYCKKFRDLLTGLKHDNNQDIR